MTIITMANHISKRINNRHIQIKITQNFMEDEVEAVEGEAVEEEADLQMKLLKPLRRRVHHH